MLHKHHLGNLGGLWFQIFMLVIKEMSVSILLVQSAKLVP